jgi:hypothetical protein
LQEAVKQLLQKLRHATKFVRAQRQLMLAGIMLLLLLRDAAPNSIPVEGADACSIGTCLLALSQQRGPMRRCHWPCSKHCSLVVAELGCQKTQAVHAPACSMMYSTHSFHF